MIFLFVSAASLAPAAEPLRLEESMDAMGTTYSIVVYGSDVERMRGVIELAFEEVKRLDLLLSNYRPNSEWSTVNRKAADGPVKVSLELAELVARCLEYSRQSEGTFDITVGPLMKVWGFYKGSGHLPHRAEIRTAMGRIGWKNVAVDLREHTIRFSRPGIEMDPGGIGKGYAVDRMVAILREHGIQSAVVTAGGSSIYGLGAPPNEARGWRIMLRHPRDQQKTVEEVFLKDMSMSTSGSYEKFFRAQGRIYSHIMDPRTGYPAVGVLSASVIAPRTVDSEAWTKPFFILGRKWAAQHKPTGFRVYLCEDRMELACAWVQ